VDLATIMNKAWIIKENIQVFVRIGPPSIRKPPDYQVECTYMYIIDMYIHTNIYIYIYICVYIHIYNIHVCTLDLVIRRLSN